MGKVYFTSDLHLNHDRVFVWEKRGFGSIEEMNYYIFANWRATDEDDVYILGDLGLGLADKCAELVAKLPGKLHLVRGNHDSNMKWELYKNLPNVVEVSEGMFWKYNGYNFYLSHFPTITENGGDKMWQSCVNLFGHTHQQNNGYGEYRNMYHVGMDSHNCGLVEIGDIIEEIRQRWE